MVLKNQILSVPMDDNDPGAETVGEYLHALLKKLLLEQEEFSSKRPFGNGGWIYDIFLALHKAGHMELDLDEDGYINEIPPGEEKRVTQLLIDAAHEALLGGEDCSPRRQS